MTTRKIYIFVDVYGMQPRYITHYTQDFMAHVLKAMWN